MDELQATRTGSELAPGWTHGCLGLRLAFGHRRFWQRLHSGLFGAAFLPPLVPELRGQEG